MGVHFEPLVGVLRIGKHLQKYGDPYDMACTVLIEDGRATMIGATAITQLNLISERDSLRKLFADLGVHQVRMKRLKPNKPAREVIFDLGPSHDGTA